MHRSLPPFLQTSSRLGTNLITCADFLHLSIMSCLRHLCQSKKRILIYLKLPCTSYDGTRGSEGTAPLILALGATRKWVDSFTPRRFYHRWKSTLVCVITFPPLFKRVFPSSVLLCGVRWFKTDVSGLRICPIFKVQAVKETQQLSHLDPWKWDR
jgi:hypothetical protein